MEGNFIPYITSLYVNCFFVKSFYFVTCIQSKNMQCTLFSIALMPEFNLLSIANFLSFLDRFSDQCAIRSRLRKFTVTHNVSALALIAEHHQQSVEKWNSILLHRNPYSVRMWNGLKLMIIQHVQVRKISLLSRRIISSCINLQQM